MTTTHSSDILASFAVRANNQRAVCTTETIAADTGVINASAMAGARLLVDGRADFHGTGCAAIPSVASARAVVATAAVVAFLGACRKATVVAGEALEAQALAILALAGAAAAVGACTALTQVALPTSSAVARAVGIVHSVGRAVLLPTVHTTKASGTLANATDVCTVIRALERLTIGALVVFVTYAYVVDCLTVIRARAPLTCTASIVQITLAHTVHACSMIVAVILAGDLTAVLTGPAGLANTVTLAVISAVIRAA